MARVHIPPVVAPLTIPVEVRMTDPVLLSAAVRGIRWTCRRGFHRYRRMTASQIGGIYEQTDRCSRCGKVRTTRGRTRR